MLNTEQVLLYTFRLKFSVLTAYISDVFWSDPKNIQALIYTWLTSF